MFYVENEIWGNIYNHDNHLVYIYSFDKSVDFNSSD